MKNAGAHGGTCSSQAHTFDCRGDAWSRITLSYFVRTLRHPQRPSSAWRGTSKTRMTNQEQAVEMIRLREHFVHEDYREERHVPACGIAQRRVPRAGSDGMISVKRSTHERACVSCCKRDRKGTEPPAGPKTHQSSRKRDSFIFVSWFLVEFFKPLSPAKKLKKAEN